MLILGVAFVPYMYIIWVFPIFDQIFAEFIQIDDKKCPKMKKKYYGAFDNDNGH